MEFIYKYFGSIVIILSLTWRIIVGRTECKIDTALNKKCCNIIKLSQEGGKECGDSTRDLKEPSRTYCAFSCYYERHIGYKNYSFDSNMIENYLKAFYPDKKDTKIRMKIENFYQICQDEVMIGISKKLDNTGGVKSKCSSFPTVLHICLYYQSMRHCPKTRFNASEECFEYMENMKSCTFKETIFGA